MSVRPPPLGRVAAEGRDGVRGLIRRCDRTLSRFLRIPVLLQLHDAGQNRLEQVDQFGLEVLA